ncbi:MAG: hypothetical protein ACLP0J_02920 [Solirubrobacteraceae bacterium]
MTRTASVFGPVAPHGWGLPGFGSQWDGIDYAGCTNSNEGLESADDIHLGAGQNPWDNFVAAAGRQNLAGAATRSPSMTPMEVPTLKARRNPSTVRWLIRKGALSIGIVACVGGCGSVSHLSMGSVTLAAGSGPTGIGRALLTEDEMKGFVSTQVVGAHSAAAWVSLEGAPATGVNEHQLVTDHFVDGLRENLKGATTTGESVALRFGTPNGARDMLRLQSAALQATIQGGQRPQRFAVPGIPTASGFVFPTPPDPRIEVIFSHGDYYVEITRGGNGAATSVGAAALSVYRRLTEEL